MLQISFLVKNNNLFPLAKPFTVYYNKNTGKIISKKGELFYASLF